MKSVLILGGSSDIGRSVIEIFLKRKWKVVAQFNNKKININKNKYPIKNFTSIKCNFDNEKAVKNLLKKIKNQNILSCINLIGYIDNISYEQFNLKNLIMSMKINTIIPLHLIKNLLPFMIRNKFGRILNISSIGVKFGGGKKTFNYSFSKNALEFIPSYFNGLAKKNILVNNLRVGVTKTKIHNKIKNKNLNKRISLIPMKRMANCQEIAKFIYQLASEENTYITRQTLSISGGE